MDGTPWKTAFRDKGAEQSWQLFKYIFLRAQEFSIPTHKKSGKEGSRPAWASKDLLVKLECKKEMQAGEPGRYILRRIQGHCPDM